MDYNGCVMLRTFGGLRLEGVDFHRPKPLVLLAYLALEGAKDRRFLAELFWQAATDPLNRLSSALARLRKAAPGIVEADHLRIWSIIETDATELLAATETGDYKKALALYQGPFLEGIYLQDWGEELEEWVYQTREYLAERVRTILLKLAEKEAAQGRFDSAAKRAGTAYKLAGASVPEPEELPRFYTLMLAGNSPYAAEVRQEAEGFGIAVLSSPEAAKAQLLKEDARAAVLSNLPIQSTPFIGREVERRQLLDQLDDSACRLLTIIAPGGMGKTRLALAVAEEALYRFRDGVFFAPFAPIQAPEQMVYTLADALSFTFIGQEEPKVQVLNYLKSKEMLLVLDNLEHLLTGVRLIGEVLEAAPRIKVLATSRERLNLHAEWLFDLRGLAIPETEGAETITQYDAVRLFVQAARKVQPAFTLDAQSAPALMRICRLVEGMPLAIELAASWLRMLTPEDITTEIGNNIGFLQTATRDLPERHQSIRAVFDTSWNLLSSEEEVVLRRLAVFRGGFERRAAAEVVGVSLPVLASLVDKSFLSLAAHGRYHLHPLVLQYAQEKLAQSAEELKQAEASHGRYFLYFVREKAKDIRTAKHKKTRQEVDRELANIRAAWQWVTRNTQLEQITLTTLALGEVFEERHLEAADLFAQTATHLDETNPNHHAALGYVLIQQAEHDYWSGRNTDAVRDLVEHGIKLLQSLKETRGLIRGYMVLANCVWAVDSAEKAKACLHEGLNLARRAGKIEDIGQLLVYLGLMEKDLVNFAEAKQFMQNVLDELRELDDRLALTHHLLHFGGMLVHNDQLEEGRQLLQESLQLCQELGSEPTFSPFILTDLALTAYKLQKYDEAEVLLKEGLAKAEVLGYKPAELVTVAMLGRVATARGEYSEAKRLLVRSLRGSLQHRLIKVVLINVVFLAELYAAQDRPTKAIQWLTFVARHPATQKHDKDEARRLLNVLQYCHDFQEAQARGTTLTLDEIIHEITHTI